MKLLYELGESAITIWIDDVFWAILDNVSLGECPAYNGPKCIYCHCDPSGRNQKLFARDFVSLGHLIHLTPRRKHIELKLGACNPSDVKQRLEEAMNRFLSDHSLPRRCIVEKIRDYHDFKTKGSVRITVI